MMYGTAPQYLHIISRTYKRINKLNKKGNKAEIQRYHGGGRLPVQ